MAGQLAIPIFLREGNMESEKPVTPGALVSPTYRGVSLGWALTMYDGMRVKPEDILQAAKMFHEYVYEGK